MSWARGGDPRVDCIVDLASKEIPDSTWHEGYIAGLLDGEGSLLMRTGNGYDQAVLTFTQKAGLVYDTFKEILESWAIRFSESLDNRGVWHIQIGGKDSVLRLLSKTRPPRLMAKWDANRFGGVAQRFGGREQRVEKYREIGTQEVVTISTSTRTFIADGLASHNCFGCGAHGDAIDWIRLTRNVGFKEAVAILGQERPPRPTPEMLHKRRLQERRARMLWVYRNRNPDCCIPEWAIA
jgi:hypothetical protein